MHAPVLVTPPSDTPVDLDQVKMHLHVDGDDEDDLIELLTQAATNHLDGYTGILGRCIVSQTWKQEFDRWARALRLPFPATSVASMKVRDSNGQLATVAAENYALLRDDRGSYLRLADGYQYPSDLAETRGIAIEFVAGYGAPSDVPPALKAAVLLLTGDLYQNREGKIEGLDDNPTVARLVAPYRLYTA